MRFQETVMDHLLRRNTGFYCIVVILEDPDIIDPLLKADIYYISAVFLLKNASIAASVIDAVFTAFQPLNAGPVDQLHSLQTTSG